MNSSTPGQNNPELMKELTNKITERKVSESEKVSLDTTTTKLKNTPNGPLSKFEVVEDLIVSFLQFSLDFSDSKKKKSASDAIIDIKAKLAKLNDPFNNEIGLLSRVDASKKITINQIADIKIGDIDSTIQQLTLDQFDLERSIKKSPLKSFLVNESAKEIGSIYQKINEDEFKISQWKKEYLNQSYVRKYLLEDECADFIKNYITDDQSKKTLQNILVAIYSSCELAARPHGLLTAMLEINKNSLTPPEQALQTNNGIIVTNISTLKTSSSAVLNQFNLSVATEFQQITDDSNKLKLIQATKTERNKTPTEEKTSTETINEINLDANINTKINKFLDETLKKLKDQHDNLSEKLEKSAKKTTTFDLSDTRNKNTELRKSLYPNDQKSLLTNNMMVYLIKLQNFNTLTISDVTQLVTQLTEQIKKLEKLPHASDSSSKSGTTVLFENIQKDFLKLITPYLKEFANKFVKNDPKDISVKNIDDLSYLLSRIENDKKTIELLQALTNLKNESQKLKKTSTSSTGLFAHNTQQSDQSTTRELPTSDTDQPSKSSRSNSESETDKAPSNRNTPTG